MSKVLLTNLLIGKNKTYINNENRYIRVKTTNIHTNV